MTTPSVRHKAPAKINLYLHVTGKRADGYHTLDSLVVFATSDAAADHISITPAPHYSLTISGPYGAALQKDDPQKNLITKALSCAAAALGKDLHLAVTLDKRLPVASGIGGGSADAAAALRAAAHLWAISPDHPALLDAARKTGADVPACLFNAPCYFGGVGDIITPVEKLPPFHLVLVNPHKALATADVFKARNGAFTVPARLDQMPDSAQNFAHELKKRRNDLQAPAITLCPSIRAVVAALEQQGGCLLARLSGSGATCFGIFADTHDAQKAATALSKNEPDWWVARG